MVDVHLVAGFLGAGKTSVLRHLLAGLTVERVGIVVNDFGEAAIDRSTLEAMGQGSMTEIRGSCVCCSAPEGLVAEVGKLLDHDRILIEPTGLARPVDLWDTLGRAPYADQLRMGPLIVVIDPHALATNQVPADLVAQLAHADVVIVNRTDLASPDEIEATTRRLADLWPGPFTVVTTSHGRVDSGVLRWPSGEGADRHKPAAPAGHGHTHDTAFAARSWVYPAVELFSRARLRGAVVNAGAGGLKRLKGLFRTDEGTIDLQWASGYLTEALTDWRRDSRCDVIVAKEAASTLDAFGQALDAARLSNEERRLQANVLEVATAAGPRRFDRAALAGLPGVVADVSQRIAGRQGAAVPLLAILDAAAAVDSSASVVVVAKDGYVTPPNPVQALTEALLVFAAEERGIEALPDALGGPFRLLDPAAGSPCANVKGVVRIAVRSA